MFALIRNIVAKIVKMILKIGVLQHMSDYDYIAT